jgi:predicted nucleic-acid-binding Zn-ribbon protein
MHMQNHKICPKCDKNMIKGRLYIVAPEKSGTERIFNYVNWEATDERKFDGLFAFKCENCGFIEYYVKKKT